MAIKKVKDNKKNFSLKKAILGISAAAGFAGAGLVNAGNANADTIYTVQKGDTLSSIAQKVLGDANKLVFMIKDKIDTLIIDPPRRGISKQGLNSILKILPNMIIYISCDPMTLARDLSKLKSSYMINDFYVADMFSYTYHVECICVLKLK